MFAYGIFCPWGFSGRTADLEGTKITARDCILKCGSPSFSHPISAHWSRSRPPETSAAEEARSTKSKPTSIWKTAASASTWRTKQPSTHCFSPAAESFGVSAQKGSGVVRGGPDIRFHEGSTRVSRGFHQSSTRFCEGCGVVRGGLR